MNRRGFLQTVLAAAAAVSMRVACQEPPTFIMEREWDPWAGVSIGEQLMMEHARAWAEHIDDAFFKGEALAT